MGLEELKEEIIKKAKDEENKILAEAQLKANEIKEKTEQKIRQLKQEADQKLASETKSIGQRENSLANMEAQRIIFEAKKEALESAYKEAYKRICRMKKKDRAYVIKNLLEKAKKEVDIGVVYANKEDMDLIKNNVEEKNLDGGVICETKDGLISVDLTFSSLFQDLREKTSKEVSKILFG